MKLEVMKAAARQLGADPPSLYGDTPRGWALAVTRALERDPRFGTVACAACGRDLAPDLRLCPYCGHGLQGGVTGALLRETADPEPTPAEHPTAPPAAPRLDDDALRRELVKAAVAAGVPASQIRGKTNDQLAALVADTTR